MGNIEIGFIATSTVADNKLNVERLGTYGESVQQQAYELLCRVNGYAPYPPPPARALGNKVAARSPQFTAGNTDSNRDVRDWAISFHSVAGPVIGNHDLILPEKGRETAFGERPETFEAVIQALCHRATIGGNVANSGLNQVVMAEALQEPFPDLHLDFIVPAKGALTERVEECRDRTSGLLRIHKLSDVVPRTGLHIPLKLLHEDGASMTLMINTEGPDPERLNAAIEETRFLLGKHAQVFATDVLPVLSGSSVGMMPTSGTIKNVRLSNNHTLFVNGNELRKMMEAHGRTFEPTQVQSILPPVGHWTGSVNKQHARTADERIRILAELMSKKRSADLERVAQIGMDDGRCVDIFTAEDGLIVSETSQFSRAGVDEIIRHADTHAIGRHHEEGTGRGDATSAAALLDYLDIDTLLRWGEANGIRRIHGSSDRALMHLRMILPGVVGRMHSNLVQYCQDSNFSESITAERYKKLLLHAMEISLRLLESFHAPLNEDPVIASDAASGVTTTLWKVS